MLKTSTEIETSSRTPWETPRKTPRWRKILKKLQKVEEISKKKILSNRPETNQFRRSSQNQMSEKLRGQEKFENLKHPSSRSRNFMKIQSNTTLGDRKRINFADQAKFASKIQAYQISNFAVLGFKTSSSCRKGEEISRKSSQIVTSKVPSLQRFWKKNSVKGWH